MGRDSLLGMGVGLQNFCLAILSLYYIIAWQAQPVCAATDCMSNVVSRCSGFLFCKVGKPAALAVAGSLVVLQVNRMKCFCCAFAIMSLLSVHFSNTHTHPFNGPLSGLPRYAGTRKVKSVWILLKQETVSGSGISWAVCKSTKR